VVVVLVGSRGTVVEAGLPPPSVQLAIVTTATTKIAALCARHRTITVQRAG
jgi:hypothetical protein